MSFATISRLYFALFQLISGKTETFLKDEPILWRRNAFEQKKINTIRLPKETKVAISAVWDNFRSNRQNQDAQREDGMRFGILFDRYLDG